LSSILRALKKLESDPRHREENQPLDSKFVPLADTSPQKTSKGIIMMVIGGGIVCGLVILAGWWLFSEKIRPTPVSPQKISQQSLAPVEMAPAPAKEAETPASVAVSVKPAKQAADTPAPRETPDRIPESASVNTEQPALPAVEQEAAMAVAEPAAESAVEVPAPPGQEIIVQIPAEEAAVAVSKTPEIRTTRMIEIPVLKDPQMKLQAITWSKDPQKRVVVINNRILRQGELVLRYRIDTINPDDIVLSEAGKKWKLLFRIN